MKEILKNLGKTIRQEARLVRFDIESFLSGSMSSKDALKALGVQIRIEEEANKILGVNNQALRIDSNGRKMKIKSIEIPSIRRDYYTIEISTFEEIHIGSKTYSLASNYFFCPDSVLLIATYVKKLGTQEIVKKLEKQANAKDLTSLLEFLKCI